MRPRPASDPGRENLERILPMKRIVTGVGLVSLVAWSAPTLAWLLRLLRRQGRHQAVQPRLAGRAGARRQPHGADDGQRLSGQPEGVRRWSCRCRRSCGASRFTSATRRWSTISTPTRRRGWSSTSTMNPCQTYRVRPRHAHGRRRADGARHGPRRTPPPQPRRHHRGQLHGRRVRHPDSLGAAEHGPRDLAARERLPDSGRAPRRSSAAI